ncbi:amidophosphoribosyltransferase [Campylobacter volucris]|uniref:Amidophosphoribosyltransferase n=1 Tax=Campylobacter volucris TaxID=1031542 RepID=A0AAE5YGT5_9BACT|nr:amidophosphoribosyltransferase [Campylobacter volucris]AJC94690.1 amidophosphoribosyltransferase [Campylobacter volucris LMG 24379]KAB0579414.1 amidophosphoribosyltransferase [Campylobacter volucris]QBL12966.1 amidophosphoribosyltransferase [Campylobacter volucris]QEL08907.1 amidophosphoribosyltransferase [Campylobacter volucris]TXK69003.1 amidophosphoribosyltransferase [Campylobacter volucris]
MCAVVGVINSKNASTIAYYALFAMQHRGQEASGISVSNGENIKTHKAKGKVDEVFNTQILSQLQGNLAIGHNRYSTAGSLSLHDAQPVSATCSFGDIALVHNGNLINKEEIRKELIENGAIFHSNMDTENVVHLIARSKQKKLKDKFIEALKQTKGAYSFILASKNQLFVARDPYGVRPLSLGKLKDGGYIVASETCAFDLIEAEFIRDVKAGEMLIFTEGKDEFESIQVFEETNPRICAFEYIYLSRPDSVIEGKSVYEVRKKMGEALAKKFKEKVDFVVPVPDSGVSAAIGFAQYLKIPLEMAIVRNHYVGRTFIEPTQEMRNLKVKLKLNPMKKVLEGKDIVVIDDSVVRGTTSKKIIALLKQAGARKIHLAIACPEIKFPDIYGIDTPTFEELISANKSVEEVREYTGADSLTFLDINELVSSIGDERKYSLISFDGDYFIK